MRLSSLPCLLLAALLSSAGSPPALAQGLLHDGTPQAVGTLSTYGMQVSLERAIHSVLPPGWQFDVAPDVSLTGKVSWGPNDTWLGVLARISARTDAGILVDWNAHEVVVRPRAATLEDAAERERVRQAASTPLPKFPASTAVSSASVPAQTAPTADQHAALPTRATSLASERSSVERAAAATVSPDPGAPHSSIPAKASLASGLSNSAQLADRPIKSEVRPEHSSGSIDRGDVIDQGSSPIGHSTSASNERSSLPASDVSRPQPDAGPARAFSGTSVRVPLEALAARHGLTLLYQAREQRLPGPVTLMFGDDLPADVSLLAQALGPLIPLDITEFRAEKHLLVRDGNVAKFVSLASRPVSPPPPKSTLFARWFGHSPTPANASQTSSDPSPESRPELGTGDEAAVTPPLASTTFEMARGERLSVALDHFLQPLGWSLVWRVQGDLEGSTPTHIEGTSVKDILEQLLTPLGLAADLYNPSHFSKPSRVAVIHASQPNTAASPGTT